MALHDRVILYKQWEALRGRVLIVYITSSRADLAGGMAAGVIAPDVVPEILAQLSTLPKSTEALDLLVVSNGGDGTVAWRIVSLIRERVKKFAVLVPQAAFSAATLITLGADEILMHPHGNLGPTDPQITNRQKGVQYGSEDLAAFLRFAREEVGLTDQGPLLEVFKQFSQEVGVASIGVAARGSQLAVTMGEKLLRLHMVSEVDKQKARVIAESLNSKYFHHGYPLSRREAKDIGLPIVDLQPELENLMWKMWLDIEKEMKIREPFLPVNILKSNPACGALFGPVPQLQIPQGIPPAAVQNLFQQFLAQHGLVNVPPAPFQIIHSIMESARHATRCVTEGSVFGARQPDLQIKVTVVPERLGWIEALPSQLNLAAAPVSFVAAGVYPMPDQVPSAEQTPQRPQPSDSLGPTLPPEQALPESAPSPTSPQGQAPPQPHPSDVPSPTAPRQVDTEPARQDDPPSKPIKPRLASGKRLISRPKPKRVIKRAK